MGSESNQTVAHTINTILKLGGAIFGAVTMGIQFVILIPSAFLGICQGCAAIQPMDEGSKKRSQKAYAMMIFIYYTCAVSAISCQTFGRPEGESSTMMYIFYAVLSLQLWIDFYVLKKPIHKMANKFADKELRQRMKAAKKEKKRMKYEALLSAMQKMNEHDRAYHVRTRMSPIERELYLKQRELAEEIATYNLWVE